MKKISMNKVLVKSLAIVLLGMCAETTWAVCCTQPNSSSPSQSSIRKFDALKEFACQNRQSCIVPSSVWDWDDEEDEAAWQKDQQVKEFLLTYGINVGRDAIRKNRDSLGFSSDIYLESGTFSIHFERKKIEKMDADGNWKFVSPGQLNKKETEGIFYFLTIGARVSQDTRNQQGQKSGPSVLRRIAQPAQDGRQYHYFDQNLRCRRNDYNFVERFENNNGSEDGSWRLIDHDGDNPHITENALIVQRNKRVAILGTTIAAATVVAPKLLATLGFQK